MSVNDNHRDDNAERDPRLARLYQAASGEEPPATLDAAILAAARREVGARPQVVGGGGTVTSIPPVRAKRNWYVPVSIAAVMVLSVSLVTLVHQEKGDELSQPPAATSQIPKTPAPPAAPAAEPSAASSEKSDAMLRDAVSAKPKLAEEKRTEPPKATDAAPVPEAYAEPAKKQREEKVEAAADSAVALGGARKDQAAGALMREQGLTSGMGALKSAPARERRPDPFPGSEREAPAAASATAPVVPAPATIPAQPSRDSAETRPRGEADRNTTRGAIQESPAVSAAPPRAVAAPRRAAPTEDVQAQSAPAQMEGRVMATPPPVSVFAAKPAPPPPAKAAAAQQRLPVWRGLEDQPPEKWLERLAEFKRDNRQVDADELLAEFRRRFPDHPASAR